MLDINLYLTDNESGQKDISAVQDSQTQEWRILKSENRDILCNKPNNVVIMKNKVNGHVSSMDNDRLPKVIFAAK